MRRGPVHVIGGVFLATVQVRKGGEREDTESHYVVVHLPCFLLLYCLASPTLHGGEAWGVGAYKPQPN